MARARTLLRRLGALGAASMSVAGCASGLARLGDDGFQQRYVDYAVESVERFTTHRLDGWTPVSRDSVVVWNGPNEAYLLKVWDTCRDLQNAERIGITETGRSVTRFEQLRVGGDRCPIQEIRRIDVEHYRADREAALAARRGGDPAGRARPAR